jgi:hypothetical protein
VILLCGVPSETPIAKVAEALDDLGVPWASISQRHAAEIDAVLDAQASGVTGAISVRGQRKSRLRSMAWSRSSKTPRTWRSHNPEPPRAA